MAFWWCHFQMPHNFSLSPRHRTKPNKTQKRSPSLFSALIDIPGLTHSFMFFFYAGRGPLVLTSKLFLQDRDQDAASTEVCLTNNTLSTLRLSSFSSNDCHGFYFPSLSPAKYEGWSSPSIIYPSQKHLCNFFHPHSQQKDTSLHWGPRAWLFPPKENHHWEKAVN